MDRSKHGHCSALVVVAIVVCVAAPLRAEEMGVKGHVVVAPELASTPWPLSEERERAMASSALVRRALRKPAKLTELAPSVVVMLEGEDIRDDNATSATMSVTGMHFVPASIVLARAQPFSVTNMQKTTLTFIDGDGKELARAAPGDTATITLPAGERTLRVREMPFVTASVRVLAKGRVLAVKGGDIELTAVPAGDYMMTFFLGSEPLRVQPLQVPPGSLLYIDATVSAKGVVDVSIKDAAMRVAVPVSVIATQPRPAPPPLAPPIEP